MSEPLVAIATIHCQAQHAEQVGHALRALGAASRPEAGCLRYDLHVDLQRPERFVMLEEWADQAALDRHDATPHLRRFIAEHGPLVEIALTKLRSVA